MVTINKMGIVPTNPIYPIYFFSIYTQIMHLLDFYTTFSICLKIEQYIIILKMKIEEYIYRRVYVIEC